ncbi:response regulator transcription factor [Geobacter sp. SVR]|uniref:response regulator transcription factor n=1 Tax=Geobacter sp. SVR TaxID=2495594 RepID=UPI00143EF61B|nr:response regulator transcription factor [Geobacter sp. SVR]BCS52132.1 DNA-binding response regulator [Geobacter sp. SVR]GCF86587.1 DNA-binding response regulator [Geobacter sp. SVR]
MFPPTGNQGTVLIVEDDRNTAALVATYLEREGFSTVVVHDGGRALQAAGQCNPIFVILDVMLPTMDGWEICRALRRNSDVPVLMLTAREEEIDRVTGLAMGADDYVVKPFSPRELVERVKAILRRSRPAIPRPAATLSFGGLELDSEKHKVTRDGRPIMLTSSEFKILRALMGSPGKAFSREELLDQCYRQGEAVIDRVIDVHIGKLRQKIEDDPSQPRFIQTVRGHGYRFSEEEGEREA